MPSGSGALLLAFLYACGVGPKTDYSQNGAIVTDYTSCALPKDQGSGSLVGQWANLPITLVFDQDFYTTNNGATMPSLRAAVTTWNSWASLRGKTAFKISNDGSGATAGMAIPAFTDCSQPSYTAALGSTVGIWKIRSSGNGANARASCGTNQTLLASNVQGSTDWITSGGNITGASILLNFSDWNAPGKSSIDVQSLLLHELGHVIGLLHSCSSTISDRTSSPNCAVAPVSYLIAVMYPALLIGQLRQSLTQNEYARVNCLY